MTNFPLRSFVCALLLSSCIAASPGQAAPATPPSRSAKPVKSLTPRQQEALRKKALDAATVVFTQLDACPMSADQPMVTWRACLADAVSKSEASYKIYIAAIRTLLLTPKPEEVGDSGMQTWYADNTRDFDAAARAWLAYYRAQCKSETSTVEPGSGMAETQAGCQLTLLKDRVTRVSTVYGGMVALTQTTP